MNNLALRGTVFVALHAAVSTVHGIAHQRLAVGLSPAQKLFVLALITVAPVLAAALLWTRWLRYGVYLLLLSMTASLIFGVVNHFIIVSNDHVQHLSAGAWRAPFQLTAVLLAVIEALGCWMAVRMLKGRAGT
jgi:hypothetical protein